MGGEAAIDELISSIMTMAGKKKYPHALAHNQAGFSSPSHGASQFSTPPGWWSEGPSRRLLLTCPAQMRVCKGRGWPLQVGAREPLAQRGHALLESVSRYPGMHPKDELCSGDFYPLDLSLPRDHARPRPFQRGPTTRQWRRRGEAERTADQSLGPAHHRVIPPFSLGRGTPVLEGNSRSASSRLLP
ncbi:hypothetical protein NN561_001980 [Cricetulus griseus]